MDPSAQTILSLPFSSRISFGCSAEALSKFARALPAATRALWPAIAVEPQAPGDAAAAAAAPNAAVDLTGGDEEAAAAQGEGGGASAAAGRGEGDGEG